MEDLKNKMNAIFKGKGLPGSKKFQGQGHKLGSAPSSASGNPAARPGQQAAKSASPSRTQKHPSAEGPAKLGFHEQPAGTPAAAPSSQGAAAQMSDDVGLAISMLVSTDSGALAAGTLRKVFGNILRDPANDKYHKLRMLNPKVQETVTAVPGGLELLVAAGFEVDVPDEAEAGGEAWATWRPADGGDGLRLLQECLAALDGHFPAPEAGAPRPAPEPEPTVQRDTRVYLPAENKAAREDMGDKFYTRTTPELIADSKARAAARESQSVLLTRQQREQLAVQKASGAAYSQAQVRVRMPDGLVIEGNFAAKEPILNVFEWVSEALRNPWAEFDLYLVHTRLKRESRQATVRSESLCPSALLHFRWVEQGSELTQQTSLRDDLLALAVPAPASF